MIRRPGPFSEHERMIAECVGLEAAWMTVTTVANDERSSFADIVQRAMARVEAEAVAGRLGILHHSWHYDGSPS